MAAGSGTVALVSGTAPLTCKSAADCAADTRIVDLVGYGSAVVREGSGPVPGASATASVARAASLADTDDNAADLSAGTPTPVNTKGETSGGGQEPEEPWPDRARRRTDPRHPGHHPRLPAGGDGGHRRPGHRHRRTHQRLARLLDPGHRTRQRPAHERGPVRLHRLRRADRQGRGLRPGQRQGRRVLPGRGHPVDHPDHRPPASPWSPPATRCPPRSSSTPARCPAVTCPRRTAGRSTRSRWHRPRTPWTCTRRWEGSRVRIADTRVTGATTAYDEIWVTVKPKENPTRRGGTLYASYEDQNTGRLKVMSLDPAQPVPTANVGDVLKGRTTGVLDYASYGGYNVQATELGTVVDNKLRREVTRKQKKNELAVATYNVENLDAGDDQAKFDTLAEGVAVNLSSPDIVSLEEIQDDNGAVNDGTTGSEATLKRVHGRGRREGRTAVRLAVHRAREQRGWRPAGRQHPQRLPLQPQAGLLHRPAGRRRHDAGAGRRHLAGRQVVRVPGSDQPGEPGVGEQPQAAGGRVRLPGASRSSSSATTSRPRAVTSRCTAVTRSRRGPPRRSGSSRSPRSTPS